MAAPKRYVVGRFCGLLVIVVVALVGLTGCSKTSGEAVVIGKEYFPAIQMSPSPNESASPASSESPPPAEIAERWIVQVEMKADRRKVNVPVERVRWEGLKEGDSVFVTYRQGKYTGTVWAAELK